MNANIQYCINNPNAEYVVLSSGLGGHASFWKPQIEALQACFHVLSYDQEGCHADSDLLHDDYCFDDLARQILKILKQHGIQKFHFIGHAIGSFIGAELALLCSAHHLEMLSLTCINASDGDDINSGEALIYAQIEPFHLAHYLGKSTKLRDVPDWKPTKDDVFGLVISDDLIKWLECVGVSGQSAHAQHGERYILNVCDSLMHLDLFKDREFNNQTSTEA